MMLLARTHLAIFRTVPDSPEQVAAELRTIAEENVSLLDEGDQYIKPQDTIEWDAANKLETASRALREIKDGAPDPRGIATVALMSISG
jgi:hypothetical protein